jgi:four helix bundle protein
MDALEDLQAWKRACRFSVGTFELLADCREYAFRDQLVRSSLSVPSNVAEGYERRAPRERAQFLKIAKGSCGEAWTQLLIGVQAGILDREKAMFLADEAKQISKMIGGLIRHFENQNCQ